MPKCVPSVIGMSHNALMCLVKYHEIYDYIVEKNSNTEAMKLVHNIDDEDDINYSIGDDDDVVEVSKSFGNRSVYSAVST